MEIPQTKAGNFKDKNEKSENVFCYSKHEH